MKSTLKLRSFIAAFGSAALLATGLVVATPAHAGMCTTDAATGVETCVNTLKDGAQYKFMVPTKNYNGTMFFWNHGFRPSYAYPSYTAPKGVEQMTVSNTGPTPKLDYSTELLALGYGLAAYDRATDGLHGWNTEESVPLLKELVDLSKLIAPTTKRNVIWGSS
ncbi:MAG: hypothetical protein F2580_05810, partial [Actinobacteria bacterium]|nr:hypothetical protein [Actinomycetota bacterium]MTA01444.1 hypothetical protein [Actinomycetota bacterium]